MNGGLNIQMKYLKEYVSNTTAGSGSQTFFTLDDGKVHTGRVYYKIFTGGSHHYSLLFANILDSTYEDGSKTRCNMHGDTWRITRVSVGVCKECDCETAVTPDDMKTLTFRGEETRNVMPGEVFASDEIELHAEQDEYLCVEISFGKQNDNDKCEDNGKEKNNGDKSDHDKEIEVIRIPCHEESILPVFVWENDQWISSRNLPFPSMIGCRRNVRVKVGFWGDSITQGCGTPNNAYLHWSALVAESLRKTFREDIAFWNLGLGYGRAQDAASNGIWMEKAKHMDWIILCFGTNDIGQNRSEEEIKSDLLFIVRTLKENGVKVLLQTLPPFSWTEDNLKKWLHVNDYIRNTLSKYADELFDIAPLLTEFPKECGKAKYVEHPNVEGCRIWAEELTPVFEKCIISWMRKS